MVGGAHLGAVIAFELHVLHLLGHLLKVGVGAEVWVRVSASAMNVTVRDMV